MHSKPAARPLMSNWFRPALIAGAIALAAPQALAQPANLAGTWAFRATFSDANCVMDGQAALAPARSPGVYRVLMRATETCDGVAQTTTDEACIATQTGTHVSVRCTVVRVQPPASYLPDDFELELVGDDAMNGSLTANWNAPAEWRRLNAANVS